jgi:hypothetical protein
MGWSLFGGFISFGLAIVFMIFVDVPDSLSGVGTVTILLGGWLGPVFHLHSEADKADKADAER